MVAFIDMIEKSFNNWTVIGPYEKRDTRFFWKCRCICGTERYICGTKLRSNKTKSCGCKKISGTGRKSKHGMYKTREYSIWRKMKNRCLSKKSDHYNNYGGRGITICNRWLEFANFYEDMGSAPNNYSLDRIDVNGNYCKENCKWSSQIEQKNNKRNTVYATLNGVTKPVSYWAKELKIPSTTIKNNIENGILSQDFIDSYKPLKIKPAVDTFRKNNISLYRLYTQIKSRCKKDGKEFDKLWINDFKSFLEHIGPRPSNKHSVDRIDNSKGYVFGNIRWASSVEQARNKTTNRLLTIDDRTLCITEWAQIAKTDAGCIRRRLDKGLSVKDSVFWKIKKEVC